jgi:hypothetical protein
MVVLFASPIQLSASGQVFFVSGFKLLERIFNRKVRKVFSQSFAKIYALCGKLFSIEKSSQSFMLI